MKLYILKMSVYVHSNSCARSARISFMTWLIFDTTDSVRSFSGWIMTVDSSWTRARSNKNNKESIIIFVVSRYYKFQIDCNRCIFSDVKKKTQKVFLALFGKYFSIASSCPSPVSTRRSFETVRAPSD